MAWFKCGGGSSKKLTVININSITRTSSSVIDIDLSQHYAGYANLTVDDIAVELTSFNLMTRSSGVIATISKSYNASTGKLTVTCNYGIFGTTAANNKAKVYIFK